MGQLWRDLVAVFQRLLAWGSSSDGRTWFWHAAIALGIAVAGWLLGEPRTGAVLALLYYWGREAVQAVRRRERLGGWLAPGVLRLDDLLDAAFPLWSVAVWLAGVQAARAPSAVNVALLVLVAAVPVGAVVVLARRARR